MYQACSNRNVRLVLLATCALAGLSLSRPSVAAAADDPRPQLTIDDAPPSSQADEAPHTPPVGNDVFLISTRRSSYRGESLRLDVWHYEGGAWRPSSAERFLETQEPQRPTCFWVHGNRVNASQASWYGWQVYNRLKNVAPDSRPFRFVIWSWPASQIQGQVRDVQIKAGRSDGESYPLAWLINQMNPEVPVGLIGYSFGARLVSGSLHILGGGQLRGRGLEDHSDLPQRRLRAVLMAGAFENYWLGRGSRHQHALSQVEKMVVMFNRNDPALRWYRMIYGLRLSGGPEAVGSTGVIGYLGAWRNRLQQVDVTRAIGDTHDWRSYVGSTGLMRGTATLALYGDEPVEIKAAPQTEIAASGAASK